MKRIEELILERGEIRPGNILKVDSFLNHQIDVDVLNEIAQEFYEHFKDRGITRILTIEASGIAIAVAVAMRLKVPVVFAKKSESLNLDDDRFTTKVFSFTKQKEYNVQLSKRYLHPGDNVLIVDDFLALGAAARGLVDLVHQAQADVCGLGIVIEKAFQDGGKKLREEGFDVYSLAMIERFNDDGTVTFVQR